MSDELECMHKEAVFACFRVPCQHIPRSTKEYHRKVEIVSVPARILTGNLPDTNKIIH
jgi:hypothetical protein